MSTVTAGPESDRSAILQQFTREFSGVYERNAYLVYNLALRTTVDRAAAIDAAYEAFLASLSSGDPESELGRLVVGRSLPLARQTPTPRAAGDSEAQEMLRVTASLPAAERAALALVGLAGATTAGVAAALDMADDAAAGLVNRSWASLSAAARSPAEQAEKTYRAWLWAEPPAELWERLYPSFYAQLRRLVSEGDQGTAAAAATVAAAAPKPSRRELRRARRDEKDAQRARRPNAPRRVASAIPVGRLIALLLIAGAAAGTAYAAGLIGPKHQLDTAGRGFAVTRPAGALSPAQIATLRAQEAAASRAYAAAQQQSRKQALTQRALQTRALRQQRAAQLAAQRQQARRKAAALKRAKLLRQQALQQQALQQQALQQQALQQQTTPAPAQPAQTTPSSTGSGGSGSGGSGSAKGSGSGSQSGSGGNPTPSQAQQSCLYNANNGTYVCPQG